MKDEFGGAATDSLPSHVPAAHRSTFILHIRRGEFFRQPEEFFSTPPIRMEAIFHYL